MNHVASDPVASASSGTIATTALASLDRADRAAARIVRAPGRVNLIGEHTDYNGGFVLPAAIGLGIAIAYVPTTDRRVDLVLAETGERATIDLDAIGERTGTWVDYVAGTAWALAAAGVPLTGFRGALASDLPTGAGLSSSAALELVTAWALAGEGPPPSSRWSSPASARRPRTGSSASSRGSWTSSLPRAAWPARPSSWTAGRSTTGPCRSRPASASSSATPA